MRRKDEPARGRKLATWRPDTALREAIDDFCDRHEISLQQFSEQASWNLIGRGKMGDDVTADECAVAARVVVCYRLDATGTLFALGMLENHIAREKGAEKG